MTIDDFCSVLGFDHAAKHILEDVWEEAARTAPQGIPPFMTMDFCRRYYPHTGGDPELLKRMEEVCRIACVDEFIDRLENGYDTEMGQGGVNVSGGQKQRLCIARAILKSPKVLILDDSTSAVDTATEGKIRRALQEKLPEMTKIIIAQRISSVQHADQIVILDNGRIDQVGTHGQLLAENRIYQEIYRSQQEGGLL